ncbi:MAG: putative baseplate assembly protein [Spirochaetales bacterium]|nr:putative baseplate assembly protein [Spirochaetales bacterium]
MDDKTYKEILEEARSLIPHYTPEWTNHNPSDPGMTLVELFAWMTEMVLYRLNKVPQKTYLALLDLMGLTLSPPQASRVLLKFHPVAGYDGNIVLEKGLQVSTARSEGQEAVTFETEKRLIVQNNALSACFSRTGTQITDHSELLNDPTGAFPLFSAAEEVERILYLGGDVFRYLQEPNIICISVDQEEDSSSVENELIRLFHWEFWDGDRWSPLELDYYLAGEKKVTNRVFLKGPVNIDKKEIEGREDFFIRGKLEALPEDPRTFDVRALSSRLIFSGDGLSPDSCLFNSTGFSPLDLDKDFLPFGDSPVVDDILYIAADEVFSKKEARISLNILLNEAVKPSLPADTLTMRYEYWDGRDWMILGISRPGGQMASAGEYMFRDSTLAFSRSGAVSFICPSNLVEREVNGQKGLWIRIRIGVDDMGKGGGYTQDGGGGWSWYFSEKIVAPLVSRIRMTYDAGFRSVESVLVHSDYACTDYTDEMARNFVSLEKSENPPSVRLIRLNDEGVPTVCFGFEKPLAGDRPSLFFELDEADGREDFYADSYSSHSRRQLSLRWECFHKDKWVKLNVNDYTDSFHRSGFVEFDMPEEWELSDQFGRELCWMRVVFESGSFESVPLLKNVHTNGVYGSHCRTFKDDKLGSGSGSPHQEYDILRNPVLPGAVLEVREETYPPQSEREVIEKEEGPDAVRLVKADDGSEEVWVRYHQVRNFYESGAASRHYVLDYERNRILFGDGKRGVIPPRAKNNIVMRECRAGGGLAGNVGAGTVKILRKSIPFLAGVENPLPARGGADLEDLDNLKKRASGVFRSRNRAVTSEDYAWLAYEASSSVGRAVCLPKVNNRGEIVVIILPRREKIDLEEKLYPSSELVRRVREYLDERKLVGSRLCVSGPLYKRVTLQIRLVFRKEIVETHSAREDISRVLKEALHPLVGGEEGKGWEYGESLQKEFVQRTLDRIKSVHHIEDIRLVDGESGMEQDMITLRPDELLYPGEIILEDRRSEF